MDRQNLGRALRLMRTFHDLGQGELAGKLGVSNSYLSELEAGKKGPTLELLDRYSRLFNIPTSQILRFGEDAGDGRKAIPRIALRILEAIGSD